MFILTILNVKTNKTFEKIFYDYYTYKRFINKAKYSKLIKIISCQDFSKWYD